MRPNVPKLVTGVRRAQATQASAAAELCRVVLLLLPSYSGAAALCLSQSPIRSKACRFGASQSESGRGKKATKRRRKSKELTEERRRRTKEGKKRDLRAASSLFGFEKKRKEILFQRDFLLWKCLSIAEQPPKRPPKRPQKRPQQSVSSDMRL